MPSLMHRGQTWWAEKKQAASVDAETVTLTRGPHTTTVLAAPLQGGEESLDPAGNVVIDVDRLSFGIMASAYVINGEATTPARGDRVIRGDGTEYEVLPDTGDQLWMWANEPAKTQYLVHAKRVV